MKDLQKAQVMKLMRTLISKDTENKEVGWRIDDHLHNSPITANECYSIVQDIPEGTDGDTRLGDRIKPRRLVVQGDVCINPEYNPDTRVMYVRVIMASQKNWKQAGSTTGNIDTAHLLRPADATVGSETNFDGTITKLRYPVNDNKFRVYYDKVFKLIPTSSASGFPLLQAQFSFKKVFKKLPASFTFDAGAGDYPNNFAPFIAIGYCYADGSLPDTTQTRVQTRVWSKLTYEDA